jgi:superoxide reductase
MTETLQVYKCEQCGNVVEILHGGGAPLVCCGAEMALLEEKTEDAATEKHVPFIERTDDGIKVRIGQNAAHPMEDEHYIEWIELLVDGGVLRHHLNPGDAPEAVFPAADGDISAREYCNVHGLWKG